jgi:hypothetical protein
VDRREFVSGIALGLLTAPLHRRRAAMSLVLTTGVLLVLMPGCATLANTPAQDLARSRWTACRTQVTDTELQRVQPDGRISFWYSGPGDEQAMRECLRRTAKGGPVLPESISEARPGETAGGGAGGM